MSKQINFYMSQSVQYQFIEYLKKELFQFIDNNYKKIEKPDAGDIFGMFLYKPSYGKIMIQQDTNVIDSIKSPVIQFNKTIMKEEENKILRGRLWLSEQYYDEKGDLVSKEAMLLKDFQKISRWIKKNVPYQEIKKGEYLVKEYVNDELKELQEKQGLLLTL